MVLLYLAGARGLLLLALAFVISGILSFVLLSKQRDVMSSALMTRVRSGRQRASGFRARIEEGARAEDEDWAPPTEPGVPQAEAESRDAELQLPDGGT